MTAESQTDVEKFAVIFDLNGTLADTEEQHWRAYARALSPHGVDLSLGEFTLHFTQRGEGLREILEAKERLDLLTSLDFISSAKMGFFRKEIATIKLMPGIFDVVRDFKGRLPLALDSTSSSEDVELILRQCRLEDCFDFITTGDMPWDEHRLGKKGKASRFVLIAEKLGVAPRGCVVIGDAEKDVIAASAAHMRIIAIPNSYTAQQDFRGADLVLKTAHQLNFEVISRMAGR